MSGKLDIEIEQGASFSRLITITDADNNPVDISGDTFAGQVRKHPKQDIIEGAFTFQFHTDGTDGKIVILMDNETTASMTYGKCVYDIEWTKSSGTVVRLLEGAINVTPEVTR